MSAVYPPTLTTVILVSTLTSSKIIYLPSISTLATLGKPYIIKDINGNALQSSIYISTTGVDTFDYKFRPSSLCALLSTNYGSVTLIPDSLTNWSVVSQYTQNAI